jgi:hypothetical protein
MSKTYFGWGFALAISTSLFGSTSMHARADEKEAKAAKPVACVMANMIERKYALDSKTVLFFLRGKKAYRVDMPGSCATLAAGDTELELHYDTGSQKLTRLCEYDSFSVEHKPGLNCPLGKFNPVPYEEAMKLVEETEAKAK